MPSYFLHPSDRAAFTPERATKADLVRGDHLMLGLNCFEAGQSQAVHRHAGADKFYLVLSGNASIVVGEETRDATPGMVVWAPADVPHGVVVAHQRTVLLIGIAPPPTKRAEPG
jgi:quercetin dioxygenase-like cupin family protein